MFTISHIDHIVLTVKHIPTTLEFYARVLGMYAIQYDGTNNSPPHIALTFGQQKINLHEVGKEFEPKAHAATPGSANLCLITEDNIKQAMAYVRECQVEIIEGPVKHIGSQRDLLSFYIRDPDFNLIEISNQI